MEIRDEVPEACLLISAESVGHVPEEISMKIHVSEFSQDLILFDIQFDALIAYAHSDCRCEPFSEIGINTRADLECIPFIPECVDSARDADKPVVAEAVSLIGTSETLAIAIPDAILLCI